MASIKYDGGRLIPTPQITIEQSYQKSDSQEKLGSSFTLTLNGSLLPNKGSPDSGGVFFTANTGYPGDTPGLNFFGSLLTKQAALRNLFSNDGKLFYMCDCDGTGEELACYPRVQSITFNEGQWYQKLDYSIVLQADWVSGTYGGVAPSGEDPEILGDFISSASETWTLDFNDRYTIQANVNRPVQTYTLVHSVSAIGKRPYINGSLYQNKEPWQWAQDYCQRKLGYDAAQARASGIVNTPPHVSGYNYVRSTVADKKGGSYSVNESWVLSSGNATEDYTITVSSGVDSGLTEVTVDGIIVGLDTIVYPYALQQTKYEAANTMWGFVQEQIVPRANAAVGITLNTTPVRTVVSKNPINGVINYTFNYDNRMRCITGTLTENIQITDINAVDVFAQITIPGRAAGTLLQGLSTYTTKRKVIDIQVVVIPSSCGSYTVPTSVYDSVQSYITAVTGTLSSYSQVFLDENTEVWNPKLGNYSRTVGVSYSVCT